MTESAAPPAPIKVRDSVSIARLHGMACIDCGAVHGRLSPAGDVELYGRRWPVVACRAHISRYMSPPDRTTAPPARGLDQEGGS
ncbi:hypothetical protein [Nonomuraea sp. NPDC023979]|uniref:hypothetical protein n=1 Tax=Nonomuraea sp. NPDC023979 TaxID=3154796 RepID=UPI0033C5E309